MAHKNGETLPILGELPGEWDVVRFGSVLSNGTRNGVYKAQQFHGTGAKIVNMGELFAHPRLRAIPMKRVRVSSEEFNRFGLSVGDLLFARRSLIAEGAGKCSVVCELDEPTVFESSIIRARPNPKIADSQYLFYLFKSRFGRYALGTILRHVAVAGITGADLVDLPVPLPPLREQQAIAQVLGTLDDKIELNHRLSETLETMTRAIFKSWFVDFDPVRAIAEGRQPFGMDAKTAALFPNSFRDSPLGEIPSGWDVGPIIGRANLLSGGTPKTDRKEYWNGDILWVSAKDVSQCRQLFLVETERTITKTGLAESATQLVPQFCTVVVARGATTGRMALLGREMAMNQTCYALATTTDTPFWLYCVLQHEIGELVRAAHGSVFDTITTSTFASSRVVLPPQAVMEAFEAQVTPFFHRILAATIESLNLAAIRDTLLPKLISGEIRVRDAERFVGTKS